MTDPLHMKDDVVGERYRIIECIGEGGMQQVYKALDTTFGVFVALKVPKNPSAEKRFARSARLSAKVTHPNVAKTLDYVEENGRPYLIEELVPGKDLGEWMRTGFFYLDPHLAAHVLHYLAKGLAASHRVNVFHRDLKPSKIMASWDLSLSVVKITDFGIAKMAEVEINEAIKEGEESITSSQTVVGALPYMAPELIESPTQAGLEADVWSAGAMMYQLVSGRYTFGAGLGAVPKILAAKLPKEPVLFGTKAQFRPLTGEIWALIRKCLCRDPKERPTADQLVEACGEICYASATRTIGRIVQFGRGIGSWGFLESADGERVFFHQDSFFGLVPKEGIKVTFAAFPGDPNARAHPVLPVKETCCLEQ